MTEIIDGQYHTNALSKNAKGGTEQMALRMIKYIDPQLLNGVQIIHSRVRDLKQGYRKFLVFHDLAEDPEVARVFSDSNLVAQFEKFIFVSNWQAQQYVDRYGLSYDQFVVIPNAIEPIHWDQTDKRIGSDDPVRIIYHTTPHRGLELLVAVFEELSKHTNIHLDVFSSFGVYGWQERDVPYKQVFDKIESLPNATNHGACSNELVREYLKRSHIFAYPSIWKETSCIAAIEALCAGNIVVHPNLAALPETCEHLSQMYQYSPTPLIHMTRHFNHLYATVEMVRSDQFLDVVKHSSRHYNGIYDWNSIAGPAWNRLLSEK